MRNQISCEFVYLEPQSRTFLVIVPVYSTLAQIQLFISVFNQLDAQNFCFTVSLFHASTCFEHMCSKNVEGLNKTYCEKNFVHQVG